jgi:hypothetical protein
VTAAARTRAPRIAPAMSIVTRSHPELPPRDYAAEREAIPTACGRMVDRQKRAEGGHLYRLWEPVFEGSDYATTRLDCAGKSWGLAHTRRPDARLSVVDRDRIYHDLAEQRRAMDVLRRVVRELSRRDANGKPGGLSEGIYEACGDILLLADPEVCARLARGAA